MNKSKEREGRRPKGQRKEGKAVKVNKTRGNDNKLLGDEKAGKEDDVSKKFPNFSLLTDEERLAFFEALTTARKNVEKRGVPTRQRFGTVHDEYLAHFYGNAKVERESREVKPETHDSNSVLPENSISPCCDGTMTLSSQGGDSPQKIFNEKLNKNTTDSNELAASERAKLEVLDQCESVIRQNTNRIIGLYVKKKRKSEGKSENPSPEPRKGKVEKEKEIEREKVNETGRQILVSGETPRARKTPRFDALSSEEKEMFFRILDEARNNVVEKNPEKKSEILPLDSIVRMYHECQETTNVCMVPQNSQKRKEEKNLKVTVNLTSGDGRTTCKAMPEVKKEEKKSQETSKDIQNYLPDKLANENVVEERKDLSEVEEEKTHVITREVTTSKEKLRAIEAPQETTIVKTEGEVSQNDEMECPKPKQWIAVKEEEAEECLQDEEPINTGARETPEEEAQLSSSKDVEGTGVPTIASPPKVMFVEDNVIDKIRNLILYLEGKARKDERLEKEYMKLLVDYVDYLSRVLEALVLKEKNNGKAPLMVQSTFVDAEVRLKFDNNSKNEKNENEMSENLLPQSVSDQNVPGNVFADISLDNTKEKTKVDDSGAEVVPSGSETSQVSERQINFLPPFTSNNKIAETKIRLLQDLLKHRAEFVEESTEDLTIIHHPEQEYVPVERVPSVKPIAFEQEQSARQHRGTKFLRSLIKCFTCAKKKEEEYGVYENLKGEAVRVMVTEEKNKDPANATLNQSVMEVLKAAGRKKIIEKYYTKS